MKGYIYVLTNPAMPGLVKIGRSIHGGVKRAAQLDCTSVPLPFEVAFEILVDDVEQAEKLAHESLAKYRINPSREFFNVSEDLAIEQITALFVHSLGYSLVDTYDTYLLQLFAKASSDFKVSPHELIESLLNLHPDVIVDAIQNTRQESCANDEIACYG